MAYIKEEEEKYISFRIPFTVYFLWKDIRYKKYRLVVKEFLDYKNFFELYGNRKNDDKKIPRIYRYRII